MKIKFIIPIIDVDSATFDAPLNITDEEYTNLVNASFNKNYNSINNLVKYNEKEQYIDVLPTVNSAPKGDKYIFKTTEAIISDSSNNDIDVAFLEAYVQNGKKFILRVNIDPSTMDDDAQEEMHYWIDDSSRLLNDNALDKKTILLSLPQQDFLLDDEISDTVYRLCGCKLIQKDNSGKNPFSLILLVEKIIYY